MQAMRCIGKAFRRPPTSRLRDRNGGLPWLSDGVAPALRCPASPQRTLLAENHGKPSLWVIIIAPWYSVWRPHAVGEGGVSGAAMPSVLALIITG